jgi:multidrug efflux pump subunit AcrA (membrane-fusion protein)
LEAQAAVRQAAIELSYCDIKAPIDGRIGRAVVSPGNLIGPDTGVLVTIVREDPMEVLFSVSRRGMLEARRRRRVGTAIFGGMLAASFLGIFVASGLYVLLETCREKVKSLSGGGKQQVEPPHSLTDRAAK